jgi:hypothetical protein
MQSAWEDKDPAAIRSVPAITRSAFKRSIARRKKSPLPGLFRPALFATFSASARTRPSLSRRLFEIMNFLF